MTLINLDLIMQNFWTKLTKPIIALAPMAGVTDMAFRQMCKRFGADVIYTEFASTNALAYNSQKTKELIGFSKREQPVVCQIFGSDPKIYFKAVKVLQSMGFAGVDINFGCPAYKVTRHGGGVSLMRNLKLCREIVQATCEGSKLPVSIKIRASIKKQNSNVVITALDLVETIKDLPISAIMLHARSYEQPFDGEPNIEIVKEVRKIWPKILLYNGGIYTPEQTKQILEQTRADGVGLARGAWGRPWLFEQIKSYLTDGSYSQKNWEETKTIMLQHARLALTSKGSHGLLDLRKHLAWYVKSLPRAASLRNQLVKINELRELENMLAQDYER
ncbi:MAG: tRNA-dihydrouridine synthase [Patescibacteria group bacterium]